MTTRSIDVNWKMRAIRVLPMFLLPALSAATYSAFINFTRMCKCHKLFAYLAEDSLHFICFLTLRASDEVYKLFLLL